MKKGYILLGFITAAVAFGLANEAAAFGANNAEEKVFSIMDRVLDMLAEFLERIFQAIADAVRSVFTGGESAPSESRTTTAAAPEKDFVEKAFDFYQANK